MLRLILIILLFTRFAFGLSLFDFRGNQVFNYDQLTSEKNLIPGTILDFSDGASFEVVRYIATGTLNHVIEVKKIRPRREFQSTVLRIPKSKGFYKNNRKFPFTLTIKKTVKGYELLKRRNVPAVKILSYLEGQYVQVDFVDSKMTFRKFLELVEEGRLDKREEEKLFRKAQEFARKSASIWKIADFHDEQVLYDYRREEWVLVDWQEFHSIFLNLHPGGSYNYPDRGLFDHRDYGNFHEEKSSMAKFVREVIRREREVLVSKGSLTDIRELPFISIVQLSQYIDILISEQRYPKGMIYRAIVDLVIENFENGNHVSHLSISKYFANEEMKKEVFMRMRREKNEDDFADLFKLARELRITSNEDNKEMVEIILSKKSLRLLNLFVNYVRSAPLLFQANVRWTLENMLRSKGILGGEVTHLKDIYRKLYPDHYSKLIDSLECRSNMRSFTDKAL